MSMPNDQTIEFAESVVAVAASSESLVETLKRISDELLNKEIIGDVPLGDAVECVDLSVGMFVPVVCPFPGNEFRIPETVKVTELQGDKWIVHHEHGDEIVDSSLLRVWRARYLLWRGHLHKRIAEGSLGHSDQQRVIADYFGGSLSIPNILLPTHRQVNPEESQRQRETAAKAAEQALPPPSKRMPLPTGSDHIVEAKIDRNHLRIECTGCEESAVLDRVGKGWDGWLSFRRKHAGCKPEAEPNA
jgi:hypothetical protein